ncbi:MAG: PTS transporter subunit EIIC [Lachnospiraceae bacterium]|nr:PTS transporter subunit EIIC [Lachnospiraceae bacterium]
MMKKWFGRLGKSLLIPAVTLSMFGILRGIGCILAPVVITGEAAGFATDGMIYSMGLFFIEAGNVLMGLVPILSAACVAAGMSGGEAGEAGLTGLVSYLVAAGFLGNRVMEVVEGNGNSVFVPVQNQFLAIICGLLGSACYCRFKEARPPEAWSFFGEKKAAVFITVWISILFFGALVFLWPLLCRWGAFFEKAVSGMQPFFMLGLPAVCLALYQKSRGEERKALLGLFLSALACSFFTGMAGFVCFPLLFLAPGLFLVYVLAAGVLTGIAALISVEFMFPNGMMELIFRSFAPAQRVSWPFLLLMCLTAILFYAMAYVAILRLHLGVSGWEEGEKKESCAALENGDLAGAAQVILEGVGGSRNIRQLDFCVTRIRFEILDHTLINEKKIRSAGIAGIIRPGKHSIQTVIGMKARLVAEEMKKIL